MATLRRRLEVVAPANNHADDLTAAVRHAVETTRATACPFHWDITIRVGDDAAETHAFERARKIIRSDGAARASERSGKNSGASGPRLPTANVVCER
jgi:hypothetical protein